MTIKEYCDQFSGISNARVTEMRRILRSILPHAVEEICYGVPTYKVNGKNIVHFGGYKNHIGFYPGPTIIEKFVSELSAYKHAKGSVQFPHHDPLPIDLVKRMTETSLQYNL